MSRRGFTLIELLVIIAIMGVMVTVGIVSITAGQGAARVKGATRDIFGAIRHARSVALVTGQPAIVTYSTQTVDGEVMAKVEIVSAKLFDSNVDRSNVQTLSGDPPKGEGFELVHIEESKAEPVSKTKGAKGSKAKGKDGKAESGAEESGGGETVEEILFAPIDADIVRGMRIKVVKGDEELQQENTGRRTKISVFSNVDYLVGRYKEAKAEAKKKEAAEAKEKGEETAASAGEDQEPVSVVWETNGRVEPHQVWVYADGKKPEDGLMIRIDRFGAAKVLNGDGRDEDGR